MNRGRILIVGNSKETTYEMRNLLDNHSFELEIALSKEVGKQVLSNRRMSLVMIHTELLRQDDHEFFRFLQERGVQIPILVMGDDEQLGNPGYTGGEVHYFRKPYVSSDVLSCIDAL